MSIHQSYDQRLVNVTTKLFRALERDPLGLKIPDLVVDRLLTELTQIHSDSLHDIAERLELMESAYAQKAYELWREGGLTVINLFSETTRQPTSCSMTHYMYVQ